MVGSENTQLPSEALMLAAPGLPASKHESPRVADLALPKSVESDNLSLGKAVIRRMSVIR
jgi:hypothetical protein